MIHDTRYMILPTETCSCILSTRCTILSTRLYIMYLVPHIAYLVSCIQRHVVRSSILCDADTRYKIRDTRDSRYAIQDARYAIRDARYAIQDGPEEGTRGTCSSGGTCMAPRGHVICKSSRAAHTCAPKWLCGPYVCSRVSDVCPRVPRVAPRRV